MIEQQIRPWQVLDPRVLAAMQAVRREDFVPPRYRNLAFADMHIPLDHDQVMMQPKQEARLLQELALGEQDRVLEIGTGSGHVTALLARLCGHVDSVDIFPDFVKAAETRLSKLGVRNVRLFEGDAARGWDGEQSYDAIFLTGSVAALPANYRTLLANGGRLAAIVGREPVMEAVVVQHFDGERYRTISLFDTWLPPLIHAAAEVAFKF